MCAKDGMSVGEEDRRKVYFPELFPLHKMIYIYIKIHFLGLSLGSKTQRRVLLCSDIRRWDYLDDSWMEMLWDWRMPAGAPRHAFF